MKFNVPASIVLALTVITATTIPATVKAASEKVSHTDVKIEKITLAEDGKVGPQNKGCWFIPGYGWYCR